MQRLPLLAIAAVVGLWPRVGTADETLSLEQALERARTRAPALLASRVRVDEARGRVDGAKILLRDNPQLQVGAGPHGGFDHAIDVELGLSQSLELGGRRSARIEAAEAGVSRERATNEEVKRELLRNVAIAFVQALYSQERAQVAIKAEEVAADILRIADKRHQAGDIPVLDVNVARAARARATSLVRASQANEQTALGRLRALLGMAADERLQLAGDLRDRKKYELKELLAKAPDNPELLELASEAKEATAETRLGEALRWPELTLGVRYLRDENQDVFLGALGITLPVFSRGQELRATGTARQARIRLEIEAKERALPVEIRADLAAYETAEDAVLTLEKDAVPILEENERLARKGYQAGQLNLSDWLLIRREVLDTRFDYLERLLEAALLGIELEARAGVLR